MAITLSFRNGSLAGKRQSFEAPLITLGRRPNNMIVFTKDQEPGVSGYHCEVFQMNGAYYVRDMGSANGTMLDGTPVKDPQPLRDGSVLELGNPGPQVVISFPYQEAMTMCMAPGQAEHLAAANTTNPAPRPAAPVPAALIAPLPPSKDGIGMPTLMATLDKAKAEVRNEYSSRMRKVYVACGIVLILAVGLAIWVKISSDRKIQDMQTQWVAQLDQSKKDADDRYNEIKKNTDASTQTKLEQLQKLLDEKTAFVKNLAADAQKAGVNSNAINQEMIRNREALKAIQAQIGDLTAFVSFKERYGKCVYSLLLRFTEDGVVKYSFVGSAFCLSTERGLLGTSARVVEAVKPLMEDGTFHLIARCDGDASFNYLVAETFVHPDFKRSDANIGKDVALLRVDLRCLNADGTYGANRPMPDALQPASDEEMDQVFSGVNIAVYGFSDLDRSRLESPKPITGLATLATNIVDGTFSFGGEKMSGRNFEMLKHNCTVMKGFAGAPVVNTKNHVVGVQSNTITLAAARGGLAIPAPNSACAVSIKALQDLQQQFLARATERK